MLSFFKLISAAKQIDISGLVSKQTCEVAEGNAHALRKRPVEDVGNIRRVSGHVGHVATSWHCVRQTQSPALPQSSGSRARLPHRLRAALHGDDAHGPGSELSERKVRFPGFSDEQG